MSVFLYILYIFIVFVANTNIYLKCSKIFHINKRLLKVVFSLVFAINMAFVDSIAFDGLFYFGIVLGFSAFVFVMMVLWLRFKTKDIYNELLADMTQVWELITFVPIFFISLCLWAFGEFEIKSILFFMIAFVFFYKALKNAINTPKIKHINLKSQKLSQPLNLVLLADIHLKKNLSKDFLQGIVKQTNELKPDAILIAGDLVDTSVKNIDYFELLDEFSSKYGTFYVLGNHEYYHGVEQIHEKLKEYNLTILDNKIQNFDGFSISGTNDLMGLKLNKYKPSLEPIKPHLNASSFNILLTHQPKFVKKYDVRDFDLVLCGHTHAGQIFPFSLAVKLEQGFLSGLYNVGKTQMYVSSGTGFWGMSARVFAPSEITHITILPKD